MALVAPRILKEPVFWRFSHLKYRWAPARASRVLLVSTGVRWMCGRMRSWAARMAAQSTGAAVAGFVVAMRWSLDDLRARTTAKVAGRPMARDKTQGSKRYSSYKNRAMEKSVSLRSE